MAFQRRRYGFGAADRPEPLEPINLVREAPAPMPSAVRHARSKRQTAGGLADIDSRFNIDLLNKQITVLDQQSPEITRVRFGALGSDQGADAFDDNGTDLDDHTPTNANFPGWDYQGASGNWTCENDGVVNDTANTIAISNADLLDNHFSVEVNTARGGADHASEAAYIVIWSHSNVNPANLTCVIVGWVRNDATQVDLIMRRYDNGVLQESKAGLATITLALGDGIVIGAEVHDDTILYYTRPTGSNVHTVRGSWTTSISLRDGLHKRIGIGAGQSGTSKVTFDDFSIFSYHLDTGGDTTQDIWGLNTYDANGTLIFGTGGEHLGVGSSMFLTNSAVELTPALQWGGTTALASLTHKIAPRDGSLTVAAINVVPATDLHFLIQGTEYLRLDAAQTVVVIEAAQGLSVTNYAAFGGASNWTNSYTIEGTTHTVLALASEISDGDPTIHYGIYRSIDTTTERGELTFFRRQASTPTLADNDVVGVVDFAGHDGTDYNVSARIFVDVDGAVAANQVPMQMILQTSATNSVGLVDNLTLTSALAKVGTDLDLDGNALLNATGVLAATITVVDSTDATSFIAMFDSATGSLAAKTDLGLTYNATTGMLTATGLTGPLTGNAATATKLATARDINSVAFDGTANITVTAAAGTLTGNTLNATVVTSSLTAIGTLASGAVPASLVTAGTFGTGAFVFDNTVSGITTLTATTLAGTLSTATQNSVTTMTGLVTTGALNSGSITSGFGNIDIGASTFDTTGAVATGALTVAGAVIVNEAGADVDFRIEGVGEVDAFFLQGSDGNVGIGTSSPATEFHVNSSSDTRITISDGAGANAGSYIRQNGVDLQIGNTETGDLGLFVDNDASKGVFIQTGGNVGIGTATPATLLDVNGAATIRADLLFNGDGSGLIYGDTYGNDINWTQAAAAQNTWYNISDADMISGELNGVTHDGSGKLTVTEPGRYLIIYSLSFSNNTANDHIETGIEINGSGAAIEPGQAHGEVKFANQEHHLGSSAIYDLADNATVEVAIQTKDNNTPNLVVEHLNLSVTMVGGT